MNISDIGDTMTLDIVQEADVQDMVGVDRPELLNQPVIVGTGPAMLSTWVYNLTASELLDVKLEFWATVGAQPVKLAETMLASLPAGAPTLATATWAAPSPGSGTSPPKLRSPGIQPPHRARRVSSPAALPC